MSSLGTELLDLNIQSTDYQWYLATSDSLQPFSLPPSYEVAGMNIEYKEPNHESYQSLEMMEEVNELALNKSAELPRKTPEPQFEVKVKGLQKPSKTRKYQKVRVKVGRKKRVYPDEIVIKKGEGTPGKFVDCSNRIGVYADDLSVPFVHDEVTVLPKNQLQVLIRPSRMRGVGEAPIFPEALCAGPLTYLLCLIHPKKPEWENLNLRNEIRLINADDELLPASFLHIETKKTLTFENEKSIIKGYFLKFKNLGTDFRLIVGDGFTSTPFSVVKSRTSEMRAFWSKFKIGNVKKLAMNRTRRYSKPKDYSINE